MGELALLIPLAPFLLGGFAIWMRHQSKLEQARTLGVKILTEEEFLQMMDGEKS